MKGSVIYIPHGGGPMPLLGDPGHRKMNTFLTQSKGILKKPGAVIVISAHWEEDVPVVTTGATPELIYDYYGFPMESYEIQYNAPGEPDLASRALSRLKDAGIAARGDAARGFDHGLFVPLKLMLPEADVPCIQISLCRDLSPDAHFAAGEALAPLLEEDIWILGSGFSFHNMRGFDMHSPDGPDTDQSNQAFQDFLSRTCAGNDSLTPALRKKALQDWEKAPGARHCHPREEHLLPLMVCAGAAGYTRATTVFDGEILGRRALSFLWK